MGVTVIGLDALIRDLKTLPDRAPKKFAAVVGKGANNIKTAWKARWSPEIGRPPQDLPHVVRFIGYDRVPEKGPRYVAEIGVSRRSSQASLAHFAEFGLVNQAPHPGGLPSLLEEEPRYVNAVGDAAVELLEGK